MFSDEQTRAALSKYAFRYDPQTQASGESHVRYLGGGLESIPFVEGETAQISMRIGVDGGLVTEIVKELHIDGNIVGQVMFQDDHDEAGGFTLVSHQIDWGALVELAKTHTKVAEVVSKLTSVVH